MKNIAAGGLLLAILTCFSCKTSKPIADCIDPDKINSDQICTMQYEPVCGCDGKTYGNACEADRAGVTAYTQGPCAAKQ